MQKLIEDVEALVENWDVWSVQSTDEGKREMVIKRSDEDQASVTIVVTASYPRGSITLTSNYGGTFSASNKEIEEALDDALEQWCSEEETGGMGREGSSVMFDMAAAAGGVTEHINPDELSTARDALNAAIIDPKLDGMAGYFFNDGRKEFVVRVGIPLSTLDQFRAKSLGLERAMALVMELQWHWKYVAGSDLPKVSDVFMCDLAHMSDEKPKTHNPNIGALKWYFTQRMSDALRKNHIRHERTRMGFEEYDKKNAVEGLHDWNFKFPTEDFYRSGNKNILVGIRDLLMMRLEKCTSNCLICDTSLELDGMKTGICASELCRHSLENYGIGTDVLSEIRNSDVVSELLIYLSHASASQGGSRDTFNPMCPVEIEGKAPHGYKGPMHFYRGKYGDNNNKSFDVLCQTIQKIPSIPNMIKAAKGSNAQLKQHLTSIDPLVYPLLQWILASNRTHLEPIPTKHQIKGLGAHQFHLISSHPEKERIFRQRRAERAKAKGGNGSFYAWHGSAPNNWHCILRGGLRNYSGTKFMSAGQAYGAGIYLAKRMGISNGYMGSALGSWKNNELIPNKRGCTLIALCEVVDDPSGYKDHGNDIVTVQNEDLVDTRFLFVFPDGANSAGDLRAGDLVIPKELLDLS